MEIRDIYKRQIMALFREQVSQDGAMVREFCEALLAGNTWRAEEFLGEYLEMTVSLCDTFARQNLKEDFYHGSLLGVLSFEGSWYVTRRTQI